MCSRDKKELLRYLGYSGQELTKEISKTIDETLKKASSYKALHTFLTADVEFMENSVVLANTGIELIGTDIRNYLKGADKCIAFACTLGIEFERELLRLQSTSMTKALIFDAAGSVFIEKAADRAEAEILRPYLEKGYFSRYRYSPGYGDLPIDLQKELVTVMECPKKIGLTATENNILIPRKSITAFIGLFKEPQKNPASKCELCKMHDSCTMRKDGFYCD